jgi:radical SAM protein with 4Fe4S-binding SPASM domain
VLERLLHHADRLLGRFSWFRRIHHPSAIVRLIRPERSHWSGVTLRCWRQDSPDRLDAVTGSLCVTVWRISWRGLARVCERRVPLAGIGDRQLCPVYWEPADGPSGVRFLMTVRQTDEANRRLASPPLYFTWRRSGVQPIHSQPEADVPFPAAILLSPVTQCNLNCIHCISRHSRGEVAVLGDAVWADVVAEAGSGRLKHLRSDYSGDLLFSDRRHGGWLDKMIALSIPFAVTTHANDLDDVATEKLLGAQLFSINFSIDSLDPDDYRRIRHGARPLDDVLGRIRTFMAARNARRPEIETILSFVLMRRNLDCLDQAIDLAAELGMSSVQAGHLHAYTIDMAEESVLLEPARYARAYDALMAKAAVRGVNLVLPPPVRARASRREHEPCPYPWSTMVLLGNGDVMGCCVPGTTIGNVRDSSIEAVWNGDAMREFRRRVNSDTPPDACSVCPMRRLDNNFASYVPGLPEHERARFETRCLDALEQQVEPYRYSARG